MSDIGLSASINFTQSLEKALDCCVEVNIDSNLLESKYHLSLSLVVMSALPMKDRNKNRNRSLTKSVANLSNVSVSAIVLIWKEAPKNETSPKEAWSTNSAHIGGVKLQEYSACSSNFPSTQDQNKESARTDTSLQTKSMISKHITEA